jgi:hypothetical protein
VSSTGWTVHITIEGAQRKVRRMNKEGKTGHLLARAVYQSYMQELWSNMKYGLEACAATLNELENGLGSMDVYLISKTRGGAINSNSALVRATQFLRHETEQPTGGNHSGADQLLPPTLCDGHSARNHKYV